MRKSLFFKFILITTLFLFANAKELKVIGPWEISGIEPTQSGYIFSRMQVAETLVTVNDKGELIPSLARKWDVSDDGLVWTFDIRENVKFHDGSTLNADTVVSNLNRSAVLKKSVLSNLSLKNIEAKGNSIKITLDSRFSALPAYLAHYSTIILSNSNKP